jgi:hypothetical protein
MIRPAAGSGGTRVSVSGQALHVFERHALLRKSVMVVTRSEWGESRPARPVPLRRRLTMRQISTTALASIEQNAALWEQWSPACLRQRWRRTEDKRRTGMAIYGLVRPCCLA